VGKLGRRLVNLTKGVIISEFGVKKLVLDTFFLFNTYKLILMEIDRGNGRLRQISSISFFKDLTIL